MQRLRRRPLIAATTALLTVAFLVFFGYAIYLADAAGELPWQVDPTRIPVTPFSGFTAPTPLPTAAP